MAYLGCLGHGAKESETVMSKGLLERGSESLAKDIMFGKTAGVHGIVGELL